MKVYAPNTEFNGTRGGVTFHKGVATVDEDADLRYFRKAGYGIGEPAEKPESATPDWDARDIARTGPHKVGTALRDAAVDPHPEDFLPPTNAGEADPHGPLVVAPEVHASGPAGVKPGEVHVDDPAAQDAAETALAESVLVNNEEHPSAPADADHGPLGMSDPGSVAMGTEDAGEPGGAPAKSASKGAWVDYAVSQGADRDEADAMTRNDLVERYG